MREAGAVPAAVAAAYIGMGPIPFFSLHYNGPRAIAHRGKRLANFLSAPALEPNVPLVPSCSNCGQKISIPEELKGKQVRCPKCSKCFVVERRKKWVAGIIRCCNGARRAGSRRPANRGGPE